MAEIERPAPVIVTIPVPMRCAQVRVGMSSTVCGACKQPAGEFFEPPGRPRAGRIPVVQVDARRDVHGDTSAISPGCVFVTIAELRRDAENSAAIVIEPE